MLKAAKINKRTQWLQMQANKRSKSKILRQLVKFLLKVMKDLPKNKQLQLQRQSNLLAQMLRKIKWLTFNPKILIQMQPRFLVIIKMTKPVRRFPSIMKSNQQNRYKNKLLVLPSRNKISNLLQNKLYCLLKRLSQLTRTLLFSRRVKKILKKFPKLKMLSQILKKVIHKQLKKLSKKQRYQQKVLKSQKKISK